MTSTNITKLKADDLEALYTSIGLVSPTQLRELGVAQRFQHAYVSYQRSVVDAMHSGQLLLDLKADLSHGEFTEHLEHIGWKPRTAQNYMALANVLTQIPQQKAAAIVDLEMGKWLELKHFNKDELAEFVDGKEVRGLTIDQVKEQSTTEIKQSLKEYERSINAELIRANQEKEDYKTKYETAQNELQYQQMMADEKYADIDLPNWALAIREEAAVHGELALSHVAGLEKTLTVLKGYDDVAHDSEEAFASYRAAASVTYYSIANLLIQSHKALKHAQTFLGEDEVGNFDMSLPLTDTEATSITRIVNQLTSRLTAQESLRVSNRLAKQGRVGAPKKNPKAFDDEL